MSETKPLLGTEKSPIRDANDPSGVFSNPTFVIRWTVVLTICLSLIVFISRNSHAQTEYQYAELPPTLVSTSAGIVQGFEMNVTLFPPMPARQNPVRIYAWRGVPYSSTVLNPL